MSNLNKVKHDYVQLLDSMGDDPSVVNAARVSMAKESYWITDYVDAPEWYPKGTTYNSILSEKDTGLISYLAKHEHWTPFSQTAIKFRIKMPIFIARQWFKHTVGFTRNEVSRRYVSDTPEFWTPDEWRGKAESVKQGSSDKILPKPDFSDCTRNWYRTYEDSCKLSISIYEEMLQCGYAPEQARMVLPQSMMTEFIETGNLASYARLCKLRLDKHAQLEVQWYAEAIANECEKLFPVSWAALMNEDD